MWLRKADVEATNEEVDATTVEENKDDETHFVWTPPSTGIPKTPKMVLGEPKRPQPAYFLFVAEKRPTIASDMQEVDAKLCEIWKNATKEEKHVFERKAAVAMKTYDDEMAAYKSTPQYKAYAQSLVTRSQDAMIGRSLL